ncbi:MAG: methylmalonyl-CoA epimerase [Flavobacteriales bacterium]|jgi:methylmalonyl-CoA/ethylmalonyl-CoA epimerase|nr:methylmalonyl-CoA epimerase [Flavobacteriales bacterium]MBU46163.1 methylmalonyl-CoA epimerase [Flavobacteriales bacterium]|tara:strand:+ start:3367 stop:3768 length:402 start_codon:yes stop_codon:yes gene_type:complete
MKKIEHIGIAVQNIEASNKLFAKIFGKPPFKSEKVKSEGVVTSFFEIGDSKIELVAATTEQSPIFKYLEKRGGGMHHVAFAVEDIEKEMTRLKQEGIRLLNESPKAGADNKIICFLHPQDTNGVLVELCQEIK